MAAGHHLFNSAGPAAPIRVLANKKLNNKEKDQIIRFLKDKIPGIKLVNDEKAGIRVFLPRDQLAKLSLPEFGTELNNDIQRELIYNFDNEQHCSSITNPRFLSSMLTAVLNHTGATLSLSQPKQYANAGPGAPLAHNSEAKDKASISKDEEELKKLNQNFPEHKDLTRLRELMALTADSKNLEELKKEIPFLIDLFFKSSPHLEEYSPSQLEPLTKIGKPSAKLVREYCGWDAGYIATLMSDHPGTQIEVSSILNRLHTRLTLMVSLARTQQRDQESQILSRVSFMNDQYPHLKLQHRYDSLTPEQRLRIDTLHDQYWQAGYFITHQPDESFYKLTTTHLDGCSEIPTGATVIFDGTVPMSGNLVANTPLCAMFDLVGNISIGQQSKVITWGVRDKLNVKIMTNIGTEHETYQRELFDKMTTSKKSVTKDIATLDEVKGADVSWAVTDRARQAVSNGVYKRLPDAQQIPVPENHVIIVVSLQTDAYLDTMIKADGNDCIRWDKGYYHKDGVEIIHSNDFVNLAKHALLDKKEDNQRMNLSQILIYTPKNKGRDCHHHFAVAAYMQCFQTEDRASCYAYLVDINNPNNCRDLAELKSVLQARTDRNNPISATAITLTNKLTTGLKPFFNLDDTESYSDGRKNANVWGFEPFSIDYDSRHRRTFINLWGIPFKFKIKADEGNLEDWIQVINKDIDPIRNNAHFLQNRRLVLAREKNPISIPSGAPTRKELASYHDDLRAVTRDLITAKKELKESKEACFHPILMGGKKKFNHKTLAAAAIAESKSDPDTDIKKRILEIQQTMSLKLQNLVQAEFNERKAKIETPKQKAERLEKEGFEPYETKAQRLERELMAKQENLALKKQRIVTICCREIGELVTLMQTLGDQQHYRLPNRLELENHVINTLWREVDTQCQELISKYYRNLFDRRLPINPVDIAQPDCDPILELCKLANIDEPKFFDFYLLCLEWERLKANPDVFAKIDKYTVLAFSVFRVAAPVAGETTIATPPGGPAIVTNPDVTPQNVSAIARARYQVRAGN